MRRRQQGKTSAGAPALSLVGSVRVAGRWQVALVKVPGKTLVLGATDKGLSLLSELDDDVEPAERDELVARIRDDDTIAFGEPRRPDNRVTTDRERGRLRPPGVAPSEPFSRLLDELAKSPPAPTPVRERPQTDEALALRARLERHQTQH